MSAKHTPGPWENHSFAIEVEDISAPDGWERIALVCDNRVGPSEANARLIAAAPDMLAALADVDDGVPCSLDHNGFCQAHGSGAPCVMACVRAAIAKAKGAP